MVAFAQSRYDYSRIQMEKLNRGVVAVRQGPDKVAVAWRYLSQDPENVTFDVYRDGRKVNRQPLKESTYFIDSYRGTRAATYEVRPSRGNLSGSCTLPAGAPSGYLRIPLDKPSLGVDPFGREYFYIANDATVGDMDGDGEMEIVLKWDPTNWRDNSQDGFTGPTYVDCYKLDGRKLWRIDLGDNIRSGAHYTHLCVADFDNDGCCEMMCRTSDNTQDGVGKVIGDRRADWRNIKGRVIAGPEYMTVFSGLTGEALASERLATTRGEIMDFGDGYANRSDRFLMAVAYLDGIHPSAVIGRGYYARTKIAAYDWDGERLSCRWLFDSANPGCEAYGGQGNHNLRIADVDGDGCDEIIYGQMALDHDGTGLYSTGMYHGDALHLVSDVDNRKYYVWGCHENRKDGTTLREAATGKVILHFPSDKDIGRCMAADIDPRYPGVELWSPNTGGVLSFDGRLISPEMPFVSEVAMQIPVNMAVWWDGDLLRELLDRNQVSKYNPATGASDVLTTFEGCMWNNGTKANPCLQGDILGDWREEVLMRDDDSTELRLYMTPYQTKYRFHTFLEDPVYRNSLANENVGYNQPTQPGFYFGPDLKGRKFRGSVID